MADVDILPSRGIRAAALVDGNGVAINGTQTVLQLAQRGMRSICEVTPLGVAANGATLAQLASRGIRNFCPVSEIGVATDASTADVLRRRGIQPMVPVSATGVALTGSATILTLAQRGLTHFCPRPIEITVPVSFLDFGNVTRRRVFIFGLARASQALSAAIRPNCSPIMPNLATPIDCKRHFSSSRIHALMRAISDGSKVFRRPIGT
jgi:hypothetical protein